MFATPLRQRLVLRAEGLPLAVGDDDISLIAIDGRPFAMPEQGIGIPQPHLVVHDPAREVVVHHQGVRPFLVVVEVVLAAHRVNPLGKPWQRIFARRLDRGLQCPNGNVDAMHAVVPQVARPVVEEPPPMGMKTTGIELARRCGAQPHVVVHARRCGRIGRMTDRTLLGAFPSPGHDRSAEMAGCDVGHRFRKLPTAPRLGAKLDDSAMFFGRRDHRSTFLRVVAIRLFDVHVFARLTGHDGRQPMPMVRRAEDDRVNLRIVQRAAKVADLFRFASGLFCKLPGPIVEHPLVHVADVLHKDVVQRPKRCQQPAAAATDPDHRDVHAIIRAGTYLRCGRSYEGQPCRRRTDLS